MFDIGWSELVVIAVVALVAIGPKELPGVLRMVGQWMGKARKMASEFQGQFNEAMREAEMADVKQAFDEVKEAASGFSKNNIMTSLTKDVSEAMTIDKIEHVDTPPALPTTPEPPTAETLAEAETHAQEHAVEHAAVNEPLAVTQEVTPPPLEIVPPAHDGAVPVEPVHAEPLKDAKAS